MKTQTRLQQYHNEEETQRNTDVATITSKYTGINRVLRTKEQIEKGTPATVELYFAGDEDRWYARTPAVYQTPDSILPRVPAGDWVRVNVDNLVGFME
jgi:hypothetical protein